jgi:NADPH:quinone reductase
MRAVAFTAFGAAPAVQEIDRPDPVEGEVRVRVQAASINGFDIAVANGYLQGMMEHRFPVVLGKDFAGTVDAVGAGVSDYAVGDRVFGVVTKPFLGDGSLGEYVTVPVSVGLAKLPASVSFTDGAALGLAGSAAVDALTAANVQAGERVLVAGATGGVGNWVVQLAARAGATVIATAHTDEEKALVTSLGAAETVDYDTPVKDVDVVFHLAGDPAALLGTLRGGGRLVSTLGTTAEQLGTDEHTVVGVFANPAPETLDRLAAHHEQGETRLAIDRVYPLDDAIDAIAHFGAGTKGKIVVTVA